MAVSAMASSEKVCVLEAIDKALQWIVSERSPGGWTTSSEATTARNALLALRAAVAAA